MVDKTFGPKSEELLQIYKRRWGDSVRDNPKKQGLLSNTELHKRRGIQ